MGHWFSVVGGHVNKASISSRRAPGAPPVRGKGHAHPSRHNPEGTNLLSCPTACGLRAISRKEIRMEPRGTDALPLPPRANLEQYHNRAKGLLKACRSGDGAAVRAWARQWLESLAALTDSARTDAPART